MPGVELDIKTFFKTYMNNICNTKKKIFWAEASYEAIWRVEVMDFYENVQFLTPASTGSALGAPRVEIAHFGEN